MAVHALMVPDAVWELIRDKIESEFPMFKIETAPFDPNIGDITVHPLGLNYG